MTPTIQPARELRNEVIFGQSEDCIVVTCKQLNPEKIHSVLKDLRVTEIAELSGWLFQTMCDPYETTAQQLQIRPRLRSWSLQHDEFEYLLQIHMWTIVCNTIGKNQQTNGRCVDFLGHETTITFDDDAVLHACILTFNRIFPNHQPVCIANPFDGNGKWAVVRNATISATNLQNVTSCSENTSNRIRPNTQNLTAGPQIVHFRKNKGCLQAKLYDVRGRNDIQKLEDANVLLALHEKKIPIRLEHADNGELTATISGHHHTGQVKTYVLDELANSYLLGFSQMWRRLSPKPLVTYTLVWVSGIQTTFTVPTDTSVDHIHLAWKFANKWFGTESEVRFVLGGKQIMPQVTFGEIGNIHQKIHAVLPLQGGGAKIDRNVAIKNNIARWMLLEGVALDKVTSLLDHVQKKAGNQQLLFLDQQEGSKRWEHLQRLCEKIEVDCPKPDPGPDTARARSSRIHSKDQAKSLDFANTVIESGFFITADDKPAAILKHVVVKGTGVCLTSANEAQQWLQDNAPISGDPLAVLIPSDQPVQFERPHQEIIAPMRDPQGRAILVSANMYQLGQTDIRTAEMQSKVIDLRAESHVLLGLHNDEFKQEEWERITANPVREARVLLRELGWTAVFSKVWGRRYTRHNVQVQPHAAEYVSFRAMIPAEEEEDMLRLSGAKGLYAVSFEGEGKPKKQYKIVWVTGSKQDLLVKSASIQSHGVIRNKTGFGLRVNRESYDSVFKGLRPGEDIPVEFDAQHKWKIESLPFGTTSDGLRDWAISIGWSIKPLKFLGPRAAVLASEKTPPDGILSINGMPVLLRALDTKKKQAGSLIAGPPQKRVSESTNEDWLQTHDPWARSTTTPAPHDPRPPLPRRRHDQGTGQSGPVEQQLKEHESEITNLKKSIQQLSEAQDNFACRTGAMFDGIRNEVTSFVQQALNQQETRTQSRFDELKEMLQGAMLAKNVASPARAAKKSKQETEKQMEP